MVVVERYNEGWLRDRLRREWPALFAGSLVWQEAARGGTVGAPDVWAPTAFGFVPLELKHWKSKKADPKLFKVDIRPAQRRLHSDFVRTSSKSGFLLLLEEPNFVNICFVPSAVLLLWKNFRINSNFDLVKLSDCGSSLSHLLNSRTAWRGT